jgi:hypothetical protein
MAAQSSWVRTPSLKGRPPSDDLGGLGSARQRRERARTDGDRKLAIPFAHPTETPVERDKATIVRSAIDLAKGGVPIDVVDEAIPTDSTDREARLEECRDLGPDALQPRLRDSCRGICFAQHER